MSTNENKKKYTIRIESLESPGLPTGTVFTIELTPVEAAIIRKVAEASREALLSVRYDPMLSISETIYCDKKQFINYEMPCFLNRECEECFVLRTQKEGTNG